MHKKRCMWLAALMVIAGAAPAFAESVTLLRVFLNDGTAIVSYGEYARVGDRLVFSMPIGGVEANGGSNPLLHVVNLPVSAVNWTATEKYAESARYTSYIANSAESDYAALAGEVAATLNAIVLNKDPGKRLDMAVEARKRLASWPKDHYGYRAERRSRDAGHARRSHLGFESCGRRDELFDRSRRDVAQSHARTACR